MRRVLVTGATGLLGRQVMRFFREKHWTLRGLAFSRARGSIVKCDLFSYDQLSAQFDDFKPDIVIHCAAERRPDKLEDDPNYAERINAGCSRWIGDLCCSRGAWLIYLSTNYVFDGSSAPYLEDAKPNPLNVYGQSKLAGEQAVLEAHPNSAIVRVPLLYGPIEQVGETSVTSLLNTVREAAPRIDNWQERYPTSTEDLAQVLECLASCYFAQRCHPGIGDKFRGVFHWQANERHTKYTMAVAIAEIAQVSTAHIVRVDDAPAPGSAPRPQFERMLCPRIEELLGIDSLSSRFRSDFRQGLARHLEPFV
jgi:S-adenosylmethionine synthetase